VAYTQSDIDDLKRAIATGALRVEYTNEGGGKKTEFRSLQEMKEILADMEREVNPPTTSVSSGIIYPQYGRGYL